MYRVTIALCLFIAAVTSILVAYRIKTTCGAAILIVPQFVLYGVISTAAHRFRSNIRASWSVLFTSILATAFSIAIVKVISKPHDYAIFIFVIIFLYLQTAATVLGYYLGYAFVEGERLHSRNPNYWSGKLVAVVMVATAVLAMAALLIIHA